MQLIKFKNFKKIDNGVVITSQAGHHVVYARNPYGNFNIVLVAQINENFAEAYCHGIQPVLENLQGTKAYRKVIKFLSKKKAECLYKHFNLNPRKTMDETLDKHGVPKVTIRDILARSIQENRIEQIIENYVTVQFKVK
jgi:hypothetical protein